MMTNYFRPILADMRRVKRVCFCSVCQGVRPPIDSRQIRKHEILFGLYVNNSSDSLTDVLPSSSHVKTRSQKILREQNTKEELPEDLPEQSVLENSDDISNTQLKKNNYSRLGRAVQKKQKW